MENQLFNLINDLNNSIPELKSKKIDNFQPLINQEENLRNKKEAYISKNLTNEADAKVNK